MGALASDDQQLFITTHSSSVLNRLGIEALQFLGPAAPVKLDELSTGTVGYFKKLTRGNPTMAAKFAELKQAQISDLE